MVLHATFIFSENSCVAIEGQTTKELICASKTILVIDNAWLSNERCGSAPSLSSLTANVVDYCKRNSTCAVPILKIKENFVNINYHCLGLF